MSNISEYIVKLPYIHGIYGMFGSSPVGVFED